MRERNLSAFRLLPVTSPSPTTFEAAYRSELRGLYRFLGRLGIPASSLEDVLHDVFLVAWKKWDTYDPSRAIRPWLCGIAFRVAADHRALKRNTSEVDELPAEFSREVVDPSGRVDAERVLQRALSRMPVEARAVFVMHELEERPIPEVAESMGTLVPTAYSRLRSARLVFAEVANLVAQEAR